MSDEYIIRPDGVVSRVTMWDYWWEFMPMKGPLDAKWKWAIKIPIFLAWLAVALTCVVSFIVIRSVFRVLMLAMKAYLFRG